jgi:hypothetical protein
MFELRVRCGFELAPDELLGLIKTAQFRHTCADWALHVAAASLCAPESAIAHCRAELRAQIDEILLTMGRGGAAEGTNHD